MTLFSRSFDYFAIQSLLNAVVLTVCGVLVSTRSSNRKNHFFALHCITGALVYYFAFVWRLSTTASEALLMFRAVMFFTMMLPATHFHHILMVFDLSNRFRRKILFGLYFFGACLIVADFTPYLIAGVQQRLTFPFWAIPGPLFYVHMIMLASTVAYTLYLIWTVRSTASPVMRNKLWWLLVATLFGYGGAGSNWPIYFNIPFPPILNFTVSFYILIATFLFFQLGLIDIRLFFRDFVVHAVTCLLIGSAFSALSYPFVPSIRATVGYFLLAFAVPLVYRPLFVAVKKLLTRLHLRDASDRLQAVDAIMDRIRETTYTYDDLAENISKSLLSTFPIDMAAVYFFDMGRKELHLRAQKGMRQPEARDLRFNRSTLAISETDALMRYIGEKKDLVMRDALESKPDITDLERSVVESLERIEAEVCAPFLFSGKVKGLLALGRKRDNTIFNAEDLSAVFAFGRMGEEVMRYIMGMEAELNHTALYSHDMNNDTKSLVQTLEFLRSPMAAKVTPERIGQLLVQAKDVAMRLNQTFQLNRDRSGLIMKSIRGEYERVPIDMGGVVRSSVGKFELLAEKQGARLESDIMPGRAMILGNTDDLIRVLDNLIANALRYIGPHGTIKVAASIIDNAFHLTVKDDGEGIDPADIDRIWGMGWQVKNAKQGASGFGLSIARQIVQVNGGSIEAESEGHGKGTMFVIKIPLLAEQIPPRST